jgi:hypothetical protein
MTQISMGIFYTKQQNFFFAIIPSSLIEELIKIALLKAVLSSYFEGVQVDMALIILESGKYERS